MGRVLLGVAVLVCSARVAQAASLTFENLWPNDATIAVMWTTTSTAFVSADYGTRPEGFDAIDLPITVANPLRAFTSRTVELPAGRFDTGFVFGSLDMAGPCPQNCGWGTSQTDVSFGTWIDATVPIHLLWPTTDPSFMASIMRVTYAPTPADGAGIFQSTGNYQPPSSVPEPASMLLMLTASGMGLVAARRRRREVEAGTP